MTPLHAPSNAQFGRHPLVATHHERLWITPEKGGDQWQPCGNQKSWSPPTKTPTSIDLPPYGWQPGNQSTGIAHKEKNMLFRAISAHTHIQENFFQLVATQHLKAGDPR